MVATATLLTSGTYSSTTTTTTLVSNTFNTGTGERIIILILAADNYGTSGAGSITSPTSSPTLTWATTLGTTTSPSTYLNGAVTYPSASPAVGSGSSVAVWYSYLSSAVAAQDVTVTFNFSPATRTKAYQIWSINASGFDSSIKVFPSPFSTPAGATSTTLSLTSSTVQPGRIFFGVSGTETNAAVTTYETDTTNGTWAAQGNAFETIANSGSITTSQRLYVDYKIQLNASSTQTFNFTQTSADSQLAGFIVYVFEPADAPTGVTVVDNENQQASLSWTAPANWGGGTITDYSIQYRTPAGSGSWTSWSHTASTVTSAVVTGLTNGQSYEFQVAAVTTSSSVSKTGAWSTSVYANPSLHKLSGGNAIQLLNGWAPNATVLDPTKIVSWSHYWSVESPSFRSYINNGTLTDGALLSTAGVDFTPQIGTATTTNNTGIYRKERSDFGYLDSIGSPRQFYTNLSTPYATNAVLEVWWIVDMIDIVLPSTGTTSSLWFGWPTTGFGSTSLVDVRSTSGAYWAFTDATTSTTSSTGATIYTDTNTHLYRMVLVSGSTTARLYRDNVLFTQQTSANGYYTANSSTSFNLGYGVGGSFTMRRSGTGTVPSGPGPLVPFWGVYCNASETSADQQAAMLRWARAKYGVA